MGDLKNKVALVTGSSSGIGAAVAIAFAQWGTHVAVHCNARRWEGDAIVRAVTGLGVEAALFQADVSDTVAVAKLASDVKVPLRPYRHRGRRC